MAKTFRQRLAAMDEKVKAIQDKREQLIRDAMLNCKHPIEEVIEGDYESTMFSTWAPFRVCKICGYAEEGWGSGYTRLHGNVYSHDILCEVKRRYAEKFVIKKFSQNDQYVMRYPAREDNIERAKKLEWILLPKNQQRK